MSDQNRLTRRDFIKEAAVGAAAVAGAGVLSAAPAQAQTSQPWLPAKWDYEADVVVVGYGGAGIAAAIAATDAGAKVLVLEKDTLPRGGNSGCSGGGCIVGQTQEAAIEYVRSQCWGTVPDEALMRTHALALYNLPQWWQKLGAKLWYEETDISYPLIPGGAAMKGPRCRASIDLGIGRRATGEELYKFFLGVADARGIKPMLGTPATELVQNPVTKEILGVKALKGVSISKDFHVTGGTPIYVKAKKAVILAAGGYENNEEMRKNFAPHPHSAFITWYGTPFNTGDGVVMAQKVGARLWHMNKKEAHSFACVAGSKELGTGIVVDPAFGMPYPEAQSGIIVNRDGKRFMNEYFNTGHSDNHRAYDEFEHKHKPADDYEYSDYRNVPMYWVFDDATMKGRSFWTKSRWVGIHNIYTWSKDNQAELAKGWFIKADTIEALAKQIVVKDFFGRVVGMDPAALVKTIADYNAACAAGADAEFGRRAATLKPVSKPPFYAMEVCECQTNTQGGPEHNQYAQTLDLDGKPIPRLYSPGELGSIYGFLYNGAGNVPEAYAFGKIAGEHATALKPWDAVA